ncbi:TraR/DksA family transcriptional regulator [Litorimonas sp. RW-G-Af-16]|uniref:TraR/DksA family transcriptional regulator n=1 Tax=Litorimonas sp. RW-G-Af-16 TaxID=3241168 RepID=UPI00390C74A6
MTDFSKYKEILLTRRGYLVDQSDDIEDKFERSGDEPFDSDQAEIGNLDVLDDLDEMGQREVRMIDAALGRIDDGTYGKCMTCGDEIDSERLQLLPHTPFCSDHAPG